MGLALAPDSLVLYPLYPVYKTCMPRVGKREDLSIARVRSYEIFVLYIFMDIRSIFFLLDQFFVL